MRLQHAFGGVNMKNRTLLASLLVLTGASVLAAPVLGQEPANEGRNGALKVYLECAARGCDRNHIRTEVDFVNWMVDVADSEVHLIITSESTGSGQRYRLDFIGREEFVDNDDHLTFSYSNTDSDDYRVQGLTGVIAVGVARYAVLAGQIGPFEVGDTGSDEGAILDAPPGLQGDVDDPWDYWVFNVGGNIDYESEESEKSQNLRGNFSARRTTDIWNLSVSGYVSFSEDKYDLSDGSTYEDKRDDWNSNGRAFYSLADRWSLGLEAGANSSTRNNTELGAQAGAGLEYSFHPYEDWTRKRMTMQGLIYARYYDYEYITIYDQTTETVWEASLRWNLGLRQPWGTANFNATAEAFLHNPTEFYRLSAGGRLSIRIFRGLNWNIDGNISKVKDQIYLSAEELSDEEIFLQRRQLPTDYSFEVSTGFSFTFGSIYNNVVNNRFGGSGRGH
jgi:hypothetical protein